MLGFTVLAGSSELVVEVNGAQVHEEPASAEEHSVELEVITAASCLDRPGALGGLVLLDCGRQGRDVGQLGEVQHACALARIIGVAHRRSRTHQEGLHLIGSRFGMLVEHQGSCAGHDGGRLAGP